MIGVIADDLTGAAEIGAVGWRHGFRSEVVGSGLPASDADLLCIDTSSRSVKPEEAGRRVASATALLQRSGAEWVYKKVDSVLRGHVVVEVEAIRSELGCRAALLVPANPGRGRVVRNGRYFIRGKPINETHFNRDPEYPRRTSKVADLLGGAGAGTIQVCGVDAPHLPDGIVVGEVDSAADLRRWTEHRSTGVLMGGGAEFFEALLSANTRGRETPERLSEAAIPTKPEIFVCGSLSEAATRFSDWARTQGTPVHTLPQSLLFGQESNSSSKGRFVRRVVDSLASHPRVVVNTPSIAGPDSAARHQPARQLARLAFEAVRRASVSHVYLEGGATASEFLTHVGWERLRVLRELAPGVVRLEIYGGSTRLEVTVKVGSYEWPESVRSKIKGKASTA